MDKSSLSNLHTQDSLFDNIKDYTNKINLEYIESKKAPTLVRESLFGLKMVKFLLEHKDLLGTLTKQQIKDFVDSISTLSYKYTNKLEQNQEIYKDILDEFNLNIKELSDSANSIPSCKLSDNHNLILGIELAHDVLKYSKNLFSDIQNNTDIINIFRAIAIALHIENISVADKIALKDKLIAIKDLLQQPNAIIHNQLNEREFYFNIQKMILESSKDEGNIKKIFLNIIDKFVTNYQILSHSTNEKLSALYDGLKNSYNQCEEINYLLHKIHQEAQLRYNYNQLGESGYALLKRFQHYDSILHNIEKTSFSLAESFLLGNSLLENVVNTITKNIDSILISHATNSVEFDKMLAKIEQHITQNKNHLLSNVIMNFKSKLATAPDEMLLKKAGDLDKFQIASLKNKYNLLFHRINSMLHGSHEGLEDIIVHRFSQEYYTKNHSHSVENMRTLIKEREIIEAMIRKINFVEFLKCSTSVDNLRIAKIHKQLDTFKIQSPTTFIKALVKIIVTNSNPAQLEYLYKSTTTVSKNAENEVLNLLNQEIHAEIHQRTSISKMIYSTLVGKRSEFKKLKSIKYSLQAENIIYEQENTVL
jgi:hypothetical protein